MKLIAALMAAFSLLFSIFVEAGAGAHGGATLVKRDQVTGKIISAKLLDFVRAEFPVGYCSGLGLTIGYSSAPVEQQVEEAIARIQKDNEDFARDIREKYYQLRKNKTPIDPKWKVSTSINDHGFPCEPKDPADGQIEYLAYHQDGHLTYDPEIKSALYTDEYLNTPEAGFWLHEAANVCIQEAVVQFKKDGTVKDYMRAMVREQIEAGNNSSVAQSVVGYAFSEEMALQPGKLIFDSSYSNGLTILNNVEERSVSLSLSKTQLTGDECAVVSELNIQLPDESNYTLKIDESVNVPVKTQIDFPFYMNFQAPALESRDFRQVREQICRYEVMVDNGRQVVSFPVQILFPQQRRPPYKVVVGEGTGDFNYLYFQDVGLLPPWLSINY